MKTKNLISAVSLIAALICYFPAVTFAQGTWIKKADFPGEGRDLAENFSIGTKVYFGLGIVFSGWDYETLTNLRDFWEWDQKTGLWTRKADYPGNSGWNGVSFSVGEKGYIGFGSDITNNHTSKELWEYDPDTDTWNQKASFPGKALSVQTMFSIGTKGYFGFGFDYQSNTITNDFWEWDQLKDVWTRKADFEGAARYGAVRFSIGNKGYVGIGDIYANSTQTFLQDFWEWDQSTDVWTRKADFEGIIRYGAVGFSIRNKGYIGGGFKNENSQVLQDFWEWDSETNVWNKITDFKGGFKWWATGFSINDKGYLVKGVYEYPGSPSDMNIYKMELWEFVPPAITGLEDIAEKDILVYPNPTNGKFTIKNIDLQLKNFKLDIYNLLGEKIYSNSGYVPQTSDEINLSDSPRGIYFVKINDGKKFYTGKIIVQ